MDHPAADFHDCMNHCLHVGSDPGVPDENPIVRHWTVSSAGFNYYFCATHRVYHCMFLGSCLDQPYCGECATFYYYGYVDVVWMKEADQHFFVADAQERLAAAAQQLRALNLNLQATQMGLAQQSPNNASGPADAEMAISTQGVLESLLTFPDAHSFPETANAIPRDDITYQGLGYILIAHRRQHGLYLLPFFSYQGHIGYMPCGLDIDKTAVFMPLAQHEEHGDSIFKSARVWACKYQGIPCLPHDLRWVLWNIYMLANEVLYSQSETEDSIWKWRGWLWYFYQRANELFADHQIDVASPDEDWFRRPMGCSEPAERSTDDDEEEEEKDLLGGQLNTPATAFSAPGSRRQSSGLTGSEHPQSRSDASSAFTVIHHQSPSTTAATAADSLIIEDVTAEFESAAVATNEEAAADTLGIADVTAQIESTAFAFMQEVTADEGTSSAGEDTPDEDSSDEGVAI